MPGLLVIMGSGETAPTMVKPHRAIFERVGDRGAFMLDTPYGFQSNAEDITHRAKGYFSASVGRTIDVVGWRTAPPPGLGRERALASLRDAGWLFAGPGSPTYALRQWRDTAVPTALYDVLARDGAVVMASAAALTLGSHSIPVYEIYKAGIDPHWVDGLDLVNEVCRLPAVVIPHYDNAEGGNHDTRFCYLGEGRLSTMEQSLPKATFILGVDEHTAVLLDPAARTATVVGNGSMTIRHNGRSVVHPAGAVVPFDAMIAEAAGASPDNLAVTLPGAAVATSGAADASEGNDHAPLSLGATADRLDGEFRSALAARDIDTCVEAILALERALLDWSADTLTSDEGDRARSTLRGMVVSLGALAINGARDPRDAVAPFVEALLAVRARARAAKDFATSDEVRDHLAAAGVEVRDTPDGVTWHLTPTP